jgi:RNA polymerase sigma-70 factor, ECF subfamily
VTDFEALYAQHSGAVFRFALALSGNRAVAEDIVSETFVRVWGARERLDLATVIGYLLTIARHLYLEHVRRDRGGLALDPETSDPAPGALAVLENRDELDAVLADMQALAEPDRAAVLMRAEDRMPYEEIAAALGIGVGAAKVKVHRARRRMLDLRLRREGRK